MFREILERFIKDSPVAVMVRALLENLLDADKIDHWFEGDCISLNKKAKPAPFASGLAATSNVLELLDSGDHVVEAGI